MRYRGEPFAHEAELVLLNFNALARSPAWERTMLVITYDEHGGFLDHVEPPSAEDDDPRLEFRALGPRVPALVVSPRVRAGVSHDVFDHTSIIKTRPLASAGARMD